MGPLVLYMDGTGSAHNLHAQKYVFFENKCFFCLKSKMKKKRLLRMSSSQFLETTLKIYQQIQKNH